MAESPITMFGAYVSDLSISLGWGGQGGSMQMTLVEDPDNGVEIGKDSNGVPFTGAANADGIVAPPTGTACYFKYGSFFFGGVFQRWTYKEDATGGRTYNVVIESPSKLLDGVQCIIENFNGATDLFANQFNRFDFSTNINTFHATYGNGSLYNVYNLFAAYENPFYGANGQYVNFGASGFNSSGTPILTILTALDVLAKIDSENVFGGPMLLGVDPDNYNGAGPSFTQYGLDLTEVSAIYDELGITSADLQQIRIQGPVKSINALISEIAEFHQWDYFYTIEPIDGTSDLPEGGGFIPDGKANIKVRTINKSQPPNPDAIRNYIQAEIPNGTVMSYDQGKEFADVTTQKIVWGARRTRYIEFVDGLSTSVNPRPDDQFAVWGRRNEVDSLAYNIVGAAGSVYGQPFSKFAPIVIDGVGIYSLTAFELRMALAGKEPWQIYKTMQTIQGANNGFNLITAPWTSSIEPTKELLNLLSSGVGNSFDSACTSLSRANKQWQADKNTLNDKIFAAVSDVASNSYKQEYFLFFPSELSNRDYNIYYPDEESEEVRAWRVADSAFLQYGFQAPALDVAFFDGSGKMQSIVGYPRTGRNGGFVDFSPLGNDYGTGINYASNLVISQKGGMQNGDRWYGFGTANALTGVNAGLFRTGTQPREFDYLTTPDFGLTMLASIIYGINIPPAAYIGSGKTSLQFAVPPDVCDPAYFGVPQESERFNYGPWVTLIESAGGNYSPYGKAEASEVTQLAPETFGSYATLYNVGGIYTTTSSASMHESESGYIQLVGAPLANLGDRFVAAGPYVSSMDISVNATGGVTTSYKFNTWTPEFGKLAKYNIDRIAKINKNNWARAQKLRGRITKPPFPKIKFEKTNFETQKDKAKAAHFDPSGINMFFKNTARVNQQNVNP